MTTNDDAERLRNMLAVFDYETQARAERFLDAALAEAKQQERAEIRDGFDRRHHEFGAESYTLDQIYDILDKTHTIRGKAIGPEGAPYGTNHDMNCPGCYDTPFTASPRSDAYWSS